jgi:glycosyltransferase involved in cell wall biosynthesis
LRILIIDKEFPPNPHGGIGSYDLSLANNLGRLGHFVVVLTGTSDRIVSVSDEPYGILVQVPTQNRWGMLGRYLRWLDPIDFGHRVLPFTRWVIDKYQPDLVEIPSTSGFGAVLARSLKSTLPIITRFHGALGKIPIEPSILQALECEMAKMGIRPLRRRIALAINSPQWLLERQQIINSDSVTFPSQFAKHWLETQTGIKRPNWPVIPNGIDPDEFTQFRLMRNWSGCDRKLICFVGRCSLPKGASVLARAIPKILEGDSQSDILFAGPLFDSCISRQLLSLSKQFPGRINLPGRLPREQLITILANAHLLVHPSFYEISSMAVLEAMSLGLPVAASRTGPLPEIVAESETGLIFQPGDEGALANAVLELLSADPKQIARIGNAAVERIEKCFNFRAIRQQLIEFYEHTINNGLVG